MTEHMTPRVERIEKRVDILEKSMADMRVDMTEKMAGIFAQQTIMHSTLTSIKTATDKHDARLESKVDALTQQLTSLDRRDDQRKAHWYDRVMWQAVLLILGAVVGFLAKYFAQYFS